MVTSVNTDVKAMSLGELMELHPRVIDIVAAKLCKVTRQPYEDCQSWAALGIMKVLKVLEDKSVPPSKLASFCIRGGFYRAMDEMRTMGVITRHNTKSRAAIRNAKPFSQFAINDKIQNPDKTLAGLQALLLGEDDPELYRLEAKDSYEYILSRLCCKQRVLVKLRFEKGLTCRQIAAELGCSLGNVAQQLRKILEKFRYVIHQEQLAD